MPSFVPPLDKGVLIVDKMMDGVAREHPEYGAALIYNHLRPEHTVQLLDLPLSITFDLAVLAGEPQVRILARQILDAEHSNDLNALGSAFNSLNQMLLIATSPLIPDRDSTIRIEDLSLCLTNYIVIRHALYNFLKTGEREFTLPWTEAIPLSDVPRENRIAYLLSMRWTAMVVMEMNDYLGKVSAGLETASEEARLALPHPILPILPEEDTESAEKILGHAVALHRNEQEYYALWLRFFFTGERDFYFEPLWEDDQPYLETLINLLADIELEAREMSQEFITSWQSLPRSPEQVQYDQTVAGMNFDLMESSDNVLFRYGRNLPFLPSDTPNWFRSEQFRCTWRKLQNPWRRG